MTLAPQTRLGPYEIVSLIGAGGMGEVYSARDARLGRRVALKVLPEAFARDAERMARFEREAKLLASLNHPNIATIHGLEESNGVRALVMELVEGPTLADSIAKGPIPLEEALPLAKQIAEGLEYAHDRGIVHRDLKPANVKITPEGRVKLLDFGLAKALEGDARTASDPSTSPTLSHLATQAGIILGTAAYMSPEQAKGKSVDRRADIWAFGCVLFEMLTGRAAFAGETVSDVLAAVIRADPGWAALPAETPHRVRELLALCLQKDSRQRLRDAGDARIMIEQAMSVRPEAGADLKATLGRPRLDGALPWGIAAALAILAALLVVAYVSRAPKPALTVVSQILAPAGTTFALNGPTAGTPVLSPDGQKLAFVTVGSDGKQRLCVRALDSVTPQALEGTEGASSPFWSADSRSLGFFAHGKLNRIDATGGPAIAIADAPLGRGGTWSPDGTILYAPGTSYPIERVSASGGTPQTATRLDVSRLETSHRWPQFLPDGKHFLFYAHGALEQNNATYVGSLDGGVPKLLLRNESNAVYAEPGYLLFIRQGTLMTQQFDPSSLGLMGDAVPLAEHAESNPVAWRGNFSVSGNGVLTYIQGEASGGSRLLWYDRNGKQIAPTGTPSFYSQVNLSPDGRQLAVALNDPVTGNIDIWAYDLIRGTRTRLTFSSGINVNAAWSPDGRTIAFVSSRSGLYHLYQKESDGTGKTKPLLADEANEFDPSWSSDGRYLVFRRLSNQPGARMEIWALPLFGDRKPFVAVQSPQSNASQPVLSPDTKYLAYVSTETGLQEIYIEPFLNGRGRWQVSTAGGRMPRWRRDGKELFYLSPDNKLVAVEISEQGSALSIGKAVPLFQANPDTVPNGNVYDAAPDGKKFVVISQLEQKASQPLTLVVNWPALLKKQ